MLRAQYLLAILLGAALPTHAQNIVKDGDFEIAAPGAPDGSLVDYVAGRSFDSGFWTVTQGQSGIDTGDEYVYSGHKSLYLNDEYTSAGAGTDAVSQTLTTVAGQNYAISFYANASGPNDFALLFGGVAVTGAPKTIVANGFPASGGAGANAGYFQFYTASAQAQSSTTILTMAGMSSGQTIEVDNVAVRPVPEASSLLLFGLLLCGGAGVLWRSRSRTSAEL